MGKKNRRARTRHNPKRPEQPPQKLKCDMCDEEVKVPIWFRYDSGEHIRDAVLCGICHSKLQELETETERERFFIENRLPPI